MDNHLAKLLILVCIVVAGVTGVTGGYSQKVTVKATTDKKEIEAILAKEREETRVNRAYFDEDGRCRAFLKARDRQNAEESCRLAISLVEKLPAEHVLERSSSRADLAVALLWQGRAKDAIPLLKKSLEIRMPRAGEDDADTADLYSLLGTAHGSLKDVPSARSYYEKAERSYRAAFRAIGDSGDEIRFSYPRRMKRTLEAHYELVKSAGLPHESERLRLRLVEVEKEYAKYLND